MSHWYIHVQEEFSKYVHALSRLVCLSDKCHRKYNRSGPKYTQIKLRKQLVWSKVQSKLRKRPFLEC